MWRCFARSICSTHPGPKSGRFSLLSSGAWVTTAKAVFPLILKDPETRRIASWACLDGCRESTSKTFPQIESIEVKVLRPHDRIIGTSIDLLELMMLLSVVRYLNARNILEIGTSDVNTTLNLAENCTPEGRVTTIDLPLDWSGEPGLGIPNCYINVTSRKKVGIQFKDTPYESQIRQVFADSATLNWNELSGPFDLVFIDGNHHYAYVKRDTENALRHLKSGGCIVWHDYAAIKDVSTAVDEFAQSLKVYSIRGTRLALALKQ
jgi:predicted O-methyltransferase YrrM